MNTREIETVGRGSAVATMERLQAQTTAVRATRLESLASGSTAARLNSLVARSAGDAMQAHIDSITTHQASIASLIDTASVERSRSIAATVGKQSSLHALVDAAAHSQTNTTHRLASMAMAEYASKTAAVTRLLPMLDAIAKTLPATHPALAARHSAAVDALAATQPARTAAATAVAGLVDHLDAISRHRDVRVRSAQFQETVAKVRETLGTDLLSATAPETVDQPPPVENATVRHLAVRLLDLAGLTEADLDEELVVRFVQVVQVMLCFAFLLGNEKAAYLVGLLWTAQEPARFVGDRARRVYRKLNGTN